MPCKCQECGNQYKVDLIIPDEIWKLIKPMVERDSGLLCGRCIMDRIERLGKHGVMACSCSGIQPPNSRSVAAATLGKKGGSVKSNKKAAAARENGRKGGRPKKEK